MKIEVLRYCVLGVLFSGCGTSAPEIRRLHPLLESAQPPRECRVISVLPDSTAQKAGLAIGDVIQSVNGTTPKDASGFSDLIGQSPDEATLQVADSTGAVRQLKLSLSRTRPRLGAACDLSGWRKPGLTSAGNESLTIFDGPYALTASGILDKGIVFLRVRVTNNSDKPLQVGPELFVAEDGARKAMPVLSPKQVMCMLYGDKGAHLLALKKRRREKPDADALADREPLQDDTCAGVTGRLSSDDPRYAEANADYISTESLWPVELKPGAVADGLIYLAESSSLPIALKANIDSRALMVSLGKAMPSSTQMRPSELVRFFEAQKRGTPLRLTLRKGRVFLGKFMNYDSLEERVWFETPRSGMLNSTSFPVMSIRSAELIEQIPAKPGTSDQIN